MPIKFLNDVAVDTSVLYVDTVNDRVGIGTTSPEAKLEVADSEPIIRLTDTRNLNNPDWDNVTLGRIQFKTSDTTSPGARVISEIEVYSNAQAASAPNSELRFKTSTNTESAATTKMVISDTGNVGIGTTSPATKLHVGSTSTSGVTTEEFRLQSGTSSGNGGTAIANLVTGNFGISGIYFGNNTTYSSQPVYLQYQRSSNVTTLQFDNTFKIDQGSSGSIFYINPSGNVGIGTTSPAHKLDVQGQIRLKSASHQIIFNDTDTGVDEWSITTYANTGLAFYDGAQSGSSVMTLLSGGNVGIGTNSPSQKFHVVGNARVTGAYYDSNNLPGTSGQVLSSTATGTDWVSLSEISGVDGTGTANTVAMWSDSDTITDAPITFSVNNATFAGSIYSGSTIGNLTGGSLGQQLELGNSSITTLRFDADAWRVYAGGSGSSGEALRVTEAGDVGIGQTNPGAKLHITNGNILVNGSGVRQINIQSTNDEVRFGLKGNNGNQFRFTSDGTHFKLNDAGKERIKVTNAGDITFGGRDSGNNQATWMILKDQTGNVGIGTTSPSRTFTVEKNSGIFRINTSTSTYPRIEIGSSSGTTAAIFNRTTSSQNIIFGESFDTGNYIFRGGNVGIGTTSPGVPLEVNGVNTTSGQGEGLRVTRQGVSSQYISIDEADGSKHRIRAIGDKPFEIFSSSSSYGIKFFTNSTQKATILANGNVGIGTTNPSVTLHVNGWTRVNGGLQLDGSNRQVMAIDNTSLLLGTNNTEKMRITSGGNVGIGTSSPSQKLHVTGNARVTGAYYDSNNSPGTSNQVLVSTVTGTDWIDGSAIPGVPDGSGTAGKIVMWQDSDTLTDSKITQTAGGETNYVDIDFANVEDLTITGDSSFSTFTVNSFDAVNFSNIENNFNVGSGDLAIATGDNSMSLGTTTADSDTLTVGYETTRFIGTGNVGIGTTSPAAKLEVEGGDHLLQVSSLSATGNPYISFNQQGVRRSFIQHNDSGDYLKLASEYGGISFFTGTGGTETQKMTILSGGNVGIGTTSPSYKLEVQGPVDSQGFVNDEGGNKNRLLFPKGGSFNSGPTTGAIKVKLPVLWTNTMLRITLRVYDYSQNESFDVTVAGYNYVGSGSGGGWVNTSAWISSQSDIDRNFSVRFGDDGTNSLFYIGELASSWSYLKVNIVDVELNHNATVANWSTAAWSISMETTAFENISQTRTNCQVNNWKRNGQDVYYASGTGNVGIGTTSPSNKLDVNGNIEASRIILPTAGTSGAGTVTVPAGKLDIRSDSTWSNSAIIARATTNQNPVLAFYRPSGSAAISYPWWLEANGSTFQIKTGSAANIGSETVSTKVTINSSGNVGIGTTSPTQRLDVNGDIAIKNATQLSFNSNNGTLSVASHAGQLDLLSSSIFINYSSNVGIGTTTPSYLLEVSGSAAKSTGTTWINTSDERTKENIQNYTKGLNDIVQLQPRVFDYNGKGSTEKSKENIGLIAQEVIDVYPEAIGTFKAKLDETDAKETDIYNLDFHSISISMINAIKELNEKVKILEDKIQTLENQ